MSRDVTVGTDTVESEYAALAARAPDCIECGDCVERCPFGVDVTQNMRHAAAALD